VLCSTNPSFLISPLKIRKSRYNTEHRVCLLCLIFIFIYVLFVGVLVAVVGVLYGYLVLSLAGDSDMISISKDLVGLLLLLLLFFATSHFFKTSN
jgi:hypothetical protein